MLPSSLGAYFWAGLDIPNALVPGLIRLQQAGFVSTTRIRLTPAVRPLSPSDRSEYRFDTQWETEVPTGVPFLPAAIRSTQYQQAFLLPGLQTIVLQTYDSASFESHRLTDPDWLKANAELVRSEYRDMTIALYETMKGNGKRFIISNWETDNEIYAEGFTPQKSDTVLRGLTEWFRLRQEGIRQGRDVAGTNGWGGIEVNDAIEFNSLYFRKEFGSCTQNGYVGDTLHNIIKDIKPDYASYSAWESTGRGRLFDDLITIKQFLRSETNNHTQLMIGELGVPGHSRPSFPSIEDIHTKTWRYIQLAHAAIRAGITIIILWKAWDNFGITEGEGLLNWDGSERQVLKDLFASFEATEMITGVVDQYDLYGWLAPDNNRYFELYGQFPDAHEGNITQPGWSGNYSAIAAFSDGQVISFDTYGETQSQINITMKPHNTHVRWFLLSIRRKHDGLISREFGPVRLNRLPPPPTNCENGIIQRYWDHWGT